MPFTPFHFGVGAALKAAAPRWTSFSVFCFAQVVTDTEVLVYMARGGSQLHGFFHTYIGAAVVALISIVVGRPLCQKLLRWWSAEPHVPFKRQYDFSPEISLPAACVGAVAGSFSHVLLDSFMHADVHPLSPLTTHNGLFGAISPGFLHLLCFVIGIVGALICARIPDAKL